MGSCLRAGSSLGSAFSRRSVEMRPSRTAGDDDREDLAREELLVGVEEELPSLGREGARRPDEPFEPVPGVRRSLRPRRPRRGGPSAPRHEPLPIDVAGAPVDAIEARAGRRRRAARCGAGARGRSALSCTSTAARRGRRQVREVDLHRDLRAGDRQLARERRDLRLEIAHARARAPPRAGRPPPAGSAQSTPAARRRLPPRARGRGGAPRRPPAGPLRGSSGGRDRAPARRRPCAGARAPPA